MSLYQVVKALQAATGSNAKQQILSDNSNNKLLQDYLKAVMDPSISFYQKRAPQPSKVGSCELAPINISNIVFMLNERKVTGKAAVEWLKDFMEEFTQESQELIALMIGRSVGAGVGETIILKTFPGLICVPPYMRCDLPSEKSEKHFNNLDNIMVQKKADGSFCYLVVNVDGTAQAFTRNGSMYPSWLVERLLVGCPRNLGVAFVGELLVEDHNDLLNRQTGNGIYNSILKGAPEEDFSQYKFVMECWDMLPVKDFREGVCKAPYNGRFTAMENIIEWSCENLVVIETKCVSDMKQAMVVCKNYMLNGFEGGVIKDPSSIWKDHTSPHNIKIKCTFEADYLITAIYEGEGKAKGMLGGITVETSDGLLKNNCGSGFSDDLRKHLWKPENNPTGGIATIIANDVISKRGSDTKSLFLPIFSEIRFDKTEADSLERVMQQLAAAKGLS